MTPHAAFIRIPWQSHPGITPKTITWGGPRGSLVAPSQRVHHLNRATVRAAEYGTTTPTHDLGDDE
jgi:hypothetical protein